MSDAHSVTVIAMILAVLSFLIYAVEVIAALRAKPVDDAHQVAQRAAALVPDKPTLDQFSHFMETMAKLVDSLSKAGPSLTSLIASILFLAIATVGAGVFSGGQAPNPPAQNTPHRS
jgi:ABC-type glycerol-3-phosphate transport system permease component